MHTTNADISIEELSKIEGAASCEMKIRDGKLTECHFGIDEMRRFFTTAIRGKPVTGVPGAVARICGTCSNAHLLCSLKTIESAIGITPTSQTMILRQLLNFGLIIRDHALHLYVFVLPDLFNRDSILAFDEQNPQEHQLLHDCFDMKEAGNKLSIIAGGRSVHAPTPRIGGFSKIPKKEDLAALIPKLESSREKIIRLIGIFLKSDLKLETDASFLALVNHDFSFLDGVLTTSGGTAINPADVMVRLERTQLSYSQASSYKLDGKIHMVGALARLNLNRAALHPNTKHDAAEALSAFPSKNIFHNNLAQAIEILHAIDASIDLIHHYEALDEKIPESIKTEESVGIGIIEAPRGILFHRYEITPDATIRKAKIIVPTGQNQAGIEAAIRDWVQNNLDKSEEEIKKNVEMIVRAYDPCMSCASHFLKLKVER